MMVDITCSHVRVGVHNRVYSARRLFTGLAIAALMAWKLMVKKVDAPGTDDVCRNFRPENARGFTLTERYFL